MKLLILGAAGKTGRERVKQGLERGYEVVAFIRREEQLEAADKLRIIVGDAQDPAAVMAAFAGCDAVVSALGYTSLAASDPLTIATKAIIEILPPTGRFISLTGYGVHDEHDPKLPLTGRLMNQIIRLVPGHMFADGENHARVLRASQANWTLIRASRLAMGRGTGHYELGYFPLGAEVSIPRADVAMAMLDCLTGDQWLRQAPMIRS